jgi:hypothetical protein
MAMPVSGCLHLNNAAYSGTCRSIAHAVYGASPPASVSLSGMGGVAGFTTPICMTCFYGYAAPTNIQIDIDLVVDGVSVTSFGGSYYLRCSTGDIVCTCTLFTTVTLSSASWCPSSGSYYVDFSDLNAYYGRGTPTTFVVDWLWANCGAGDRSLKTACVNTSDSLSGILMN